MAAWRRILVGGALALSISAAGCSRDESPAQPPEAPAQAQSRIIQVTTTEDFDARVLRADKPVLVDFFATWCPPCHLLAPTIEALSAEYAGRAEFVKVDVDESGQLARAYNIEGYPTILIFSEGKPVGRLLGLKRGDDYRKALDAAIARAG